MITLSLCLIVKNEEDMLEQCLASVKDIADEIVIVDTGSTDRTKEIAAQWTPYVYDFAWIDDFAAARNFSFAQASKEYIFWLDADDILLPEAREQLLQLKQTLPQETDAVSMPYNVDFDEYGNVTLQVRRIRIVKRSRKDRWEGAVHEDLAIDQKTAVFDSNIVVTHRKEGKSDPDRNLNIYKNLLAQGQSLSLRDTLHYAMELHQHQQHAKAVQYYLQFLEMGYRQHFNENIR